MDKEIKKLIQNAKEVLIVDYSSHCPWENRSGGSYWFSKKFTRIGEDKWQVRYGTSCEAFDFCTVYGDFRDCWNCWDFDREERECRAEYDEVNSEKVYSTIISYLGDEFIEIATDNEIIQEANICGKCKGDTSWCHND